MTTPKYRKSRPRPLKHGEAPREGRLPAEPAYPHPGPYERTWFGCKTCGYHWFPTTDEPQRCPRCERELVAGRKLSGVGLPRDPRALLLCKCYRCGHEWFARKRVPLLPKYCGNPRCTSPFWCWPRVLKTGKHWVVDQPGEGRGDVVPDEQVCAGGGGIPL